MERRFGITAIKMGFITQDQLMEALRIQVSENLELKPHRILGVILSEMGYMNKSQIKMVLKKMRLISS